MSDGVQFTITTVEFQDGPYQGANVGEPIPTPVDPIDSTSDPTTEDSGTPITWGSLVVFLRLGGGGRDALVLDAGDVDLRQALADSSTADIAAETDLSALSAIEGLYPPEAAATTLRTGTVNFQLVAQAPAGEEVSVDGVTWGGEATIDATAAAALYQTKGATGNTLSSTPISATGTFQRRHGAAYRASTPSASGNVPMRMINPVTTWKAIAGTDANAAGLPQALAVLLSLTSDPLNASGGTLNTWSVSNAITIDPEPVVTPGTGDTSAAALAATVYQTHGLTNIMSGTNTTASAPCQTLTANNVAGTAYLAWALAGGTDSPADATDAQLAALSNADQIALRVNRQAFTEIADVSDVTYDHTGSDPAHPGYAIWGAPASGLCSVGGVEKARSVDFTTIGLAGPGYAYVGQFAVKADWP